MKRTGKNSKPLYYLCSYLRLSLPYPLKRLYMRCLLHGVERRRDYADIMRRVDYYCQLEAGTPLPENDSMAIGKTKVQHPKVYYLDSLRYVRCFPGHLRWRLEAGDVNFVPSLPSIVKSRPVNGDKANATLLNLDRVRHFVFLNDSKPWRGKMDKVIFRGALGQKDGAAFKKNRYEFMEQFFGHPMVDAGEVMEGGRYVNPLWAMPKMTLYEHLDYKFIMALEGNDVASNLKWVMSSNSIAVMPRPRYETWFMEGTLRPDYHYIEVRDDYSDLEEKLRYYIAHPEKAEAIIQHAHEFVGQFRHRQRENIIALLVTEKYLGRTND